MSLKTIFQIGLAAVLITLVALLSTAVRSDVVFFAGDRPVPAQVPLYMRDSVPALNMLVMGKDHKMYYEAYNDASDLDGDGILDVGYRGWELKSPAPTDGSSLYKIDYFGLFDSYLCYSHAGGRFEPVSRTADKTCGGLWSGDFLNYLTTSRMDALRRVLYGGDRVVDTEAETVLQRTYITQDAHTWGKEYHSIAFDGYNIADYTPFPAPSSGRHLFASTSLLSDPATPLLRVLQSSQYRIWEWVSIERPVGGSYCLHGHPNNGELCGSISDYAVRVAVCPLSDVNLHDSTCKVYPSGSAKPTGILHDYGETDRMYFGLITGSQFNNLEGGVLRRNIGSFRSEVDSETGIFQTGSEGIVSTLSRMEMVGFGGSHEWTFGSQNCPALGWRALANGECRMWGNPIAEMMYEGLRYFAGAGEATPGYATGGAPIGHTEEDSMGLPAPDWENPYRPVDDGGFTHCARPVMTVISDINPSYDSALPGNAFGETAPNGTTPTTINGFDAAAEGSRIWNHEDLGTRSIFIGQSSGVSDGAPTAKSANSFGNIRGLAPEEPTKMGSYYAASVASYGFRTDVNAAEGRQNVSTYAVAMASPLPKIEFPINGSTITLVPFAKSIAHPGDSCSMRTDNFRIPQGVDDFRPTNTIVDFYVESIENMPGAPIQNGGAPRAVFRINFEDVEQGNDHDMDVIVRYELTQAPGGDLQVRLVSEYEAGSVMHHIGYIISGTTRDGTYLEVRDNDGSSTCGLPGVTRYKLDTPPGRWAGDCDTADPAASCPRIDGNVLLPLDTTRTFTPGASTGAELLDGPLWYAAKYGGSDNLALDGLPRDGEWDSRVAGTPDNYFLVTNPLNLRAQLAAAFDSASVGSVDVGSASVSGARVGSASFTLQPEFESSRQGKDWTGDLTAIAINSDGSLGQELWDAQSRIPAFQSRDIFTIYSPGAGTRASREASRFSYSDLPGSDNDKLGLLGINPLQVADRYRGNYSAEDFIDYIAGDQGNEQGSGGTLRARSSVLGSIINSEPVIASPRSDYGYGMYPDSMFDGYSTFLEQKRTANRTFVYVGANDGMLHAFNGDMVPCPNPDNPGAMCAGPNAGREEFAFIPNGVLGDLGELPLPDDPYYSHRYYMDGQIAVSDARNSTNQWRTLLAGATGGGGRSVFVLDVSNPGAFSNGDVLWERNSTIDNDIGYTYGRPLIVPLENGSWGVLFGNGYGGNTSDPSLYILDAFTGDVIRKLTADDGNQAGTSSSPPADWICSTIGVMCARQTDPFNGLGQITAIDRDGNGKVDTVYGGDLQGNLWKFDLSSGAESGWAVANDGDALFTASSGGVRQPITGGIRVAAGPGTGVMVFFGTGRYLYASDNTVPGNPDIQSLYGIFDNGTSVPDGRNSLAAQFVSGETTTVAGQVVRSITRTAVAYFGSSAVRGWYIDLAVNTGTTDAPNLDARGERFIATPLIQSGRVFFPTYTPLEDSCNPGGLNFAYGLDLLSGAGALSDVSVLPSNDPICTDGECGAVSIDGGGTGGNGTDANAPVTSASGIATNPITPIDPDCEGPECATFEQCQVVIYPGAFVLPRPCGRQSWRQLK